MALQDQELPGQRSVGTTDVLVSGGFSFLFCGQKTDVETWMKMARFKFVPLHVLLWQHDWIPYTVIT